MENITVVSTIEELITKSTEAHSKLEPITVSEDSFGAWSFSKIKVLHRCPLKFYMGYVLKTKHAPEQVTEGIIRNAIGKASHSVLERVILGESMEDTYKEVKKQYPVLIEHNEWKTFEANKVKTEAFMRRLNDFRKENPFKEIKTELRLAISKDKKPVPFFDEKTVYLRGVLDLAIYLKNDDVIILDHKQGIDPGAYGIKNQMFQLNSYKPLLYFGYKPFSGISAGVHGIDSGNIVMERGVSDIQEVTEKIPSVIDLYISGGCQKLRNFGFFKHIRGSHCQWCEYNEPCKNKLLVELEKSSAKKITNPDNGSFRV